MVNNPLLSPLMQASTLARSQERGGGVGCDHVLAVSGEHPDHPPVDGPLPRHIGPGRQGDLVARCAATEHVPFPEHVFFREHVPSSDACMRPQLQHMRPFPCRATRQPCTLTALTAPFYPEPAATRVRVASTSLGYRNNIRGTSVFAADRLPFCVPLRLPFPSRTRSLPRSSFS